MSAQTSDVATCLRSAEELKAEGNEHFRAGRWKEALGVYRSGLGELQQGTDTTQDPRNAEDAEDEPNPTTKLDKDCSKARAILHANIAACCVKLGEHKEAVEACTQALSDDPEYLKALQRRASSNEILGTWSSLSAAQEDYNTLLKILPESDSRRHGVSSALQQLKPRIEASQKRETAEMLDKLKGVGNNILGRFGLSTDNFQFVPNAQGGYSMNFTR
ncbi:hypothetical protein APHAL10511_006231 [Amanita phalloides]|nr:hypothetical protein APHAL10511_006231 [Amanita phalloides]